MEQTKPTRANLAYHIKAKHISTEHLDMSTYLENCAGISWNMTKRKHYTLSGASEIWTFKKRAHMLFFFSCWPGQNALVNINVHDEMFVLYPSFLQGKLEFLAESTRRMNLINPASNDRFSTGEKTAQPRCRIVCLMGRESLVRADLHLPGRAFGVGVGESHPGSGIDAVTGGCCW